MPLTQGLNGRQRLDRVCYAANMWQQLQEHQAEMASTHMRQLFESDPGRAESFSAEACDIFLDYSKSG